MTRTVWPARSSAPWTPRSPARLLLGGDAPGIAISSEEGHLAEARKWAEVSRSTDHPTDPATA
ncbi:hypothetical protein ACFQ51_04265 [Streptomyces kaempferi]